MKNFTLSLKQYFLHFPVVLGIFRVVNKRLLGSLGIWSGSKYFLKLFSTFRKKANSNAIDFSSGIVVGKFLDSSYMLSMRPPSLIESYVYIEGVWEPHIANLIYSMIQPGNQIIIDIGANIGASSIPLAKKCSDCDFYLFEPHPEVFLQLKKNCALNKLENIRLFNAAVTNQKLDTVNFYAQKESDNMGLSSLVKNENIENFDEIKVPAIRLDDIFFSGQFDRHPKKISLMKIDVQGSELDVLLSAKQVIESFRPNIIFEFESEYFDSKDEETLVQSKIENFFAELEYELYCVERLSSFMPKIKFPGYFHGDILAVSKY